MDRAAATEKLNEIFRGIFGRPDLSLTDQTTAKDVPGWDSLNHINIIVATEKGFSIKFTTKEIQNLANVGEFLDLIQSKL